MEPNISAKSKNFLVISILTAALIIGGSLIYSAGLKGGGGAPPVAQVAGGDETATNNNPGIDDDVILGDSGAPVTLIGFGDYQCPFCKKMYDETEGKLRDEYVSTGKLRMVYRDFPIDQIHPYARSAAEAAECARDQDKYWRAHDFLFENQSNLSTLAAGKFVSMAQALDLDINEFRECVQVRKYAEEVEKDYQDGLRAGVTGTPGTFINNQFLPGALPYEDFKAAIEEALQSSTN